MGIPTAIRLLPGSAVFVWLASPAAAHGFGQRYDLPLPLGLWVLGAGATIVLTFAVTALYLREFHTNWEHLHFNLLKILPIRWLAHPRVVAAIRALSVVAFLATIYAGLAGTDDPYENLITTMGRVIWWVGFAFACALVGNLWALVNPIRTIFVWAEWGFARVTGGGSLARNKPYPRGFQTWPGVAFHRFCLGGVGLGGERRAAKFGDRNSRLQRGDWLGMFIWGREVWLRYGEAFSIAFGILSRFAPLDVPIKDDPSAAPALNLRPPGAGLAADRAVTFSFLIFVLLMLSTVTFDGYLETPLYRSTAVALYTSESFAPLLEWSFEVGFPVNQTVLTGQMALMTLAFLAAFWLTSWAMVRSAARRPGATAGVSTHRAAVAFVLRAPLKMPFSRTVGLESG